MKVFHLNNSASNTNIKCIVAVSFPADGYYDNTSWEGFQS